MPEEGFDGYWLCRPEGGQLAHGTRKRVGVIYWPLGPSRRAMILRIAGNSSMICSRIQRFGRVSLCPGIHALRTVGFQSAARRPIRQTNNGK